MIDLTAKPFYLNHDDIAWVEETLNAMTLEEKVGHLFCPIGLSAEQADLQALLDEFKPAGIMFRPGDAKEVQLVHQYLQQNSKVPMLIAANLESGGNGAVAEGTEFGSQMQVGATADPEMAAKLGAVVAEEGRAAGCNWAFAPVIDLDYNFHNPITNTRTYGSDPELVGAMGKAYVEAVQARGMATSIKHFPGDGVDYRDQHLVLSVNTMKPQQWDETFGQVYQQSIDAGALTVMAGHIALPEYSKVLNPELSDHEIMPASLAPELLNDLLRDKLNFNGMIVSDATSMVGFTVMMKREQAVPLTIAAGCDLFLFNKDLKEDFGYMLKGIETGLLSMARVDEAIIRTLATKAALGLHKRDLAAELDLSLIGCDAHKQMAIECADKAVTLVKNNQDILPLSLDQHSRVLLIGLGDEADMFGHQTGTVEKFQNQLEAEGFKVTLYDTSQFTMRDMMQPVEEFVADYDVVVYAAQFKTASNKTTLRINWARPMGIDAPWFSQEIPTVFISFGNPYHLMDVPRVPTYINAYTANDITIEAVVNKLMGRSEFKGQSPVDAFVGQWDTHL
ncbi:glycoside hydrolase family 3 C-terminal domain-containing protein [Photobacterium sp. SDRW27]|uniref:glycoside hydrolase family 3 protein n=1 Tax=Photobacterium obscurum TaxID=2829490 RepID=UPI0022430ADC|nr:glycoside hydrolase family 3 N-terminal domain-containing protein [Photobacterium obscurum]MCW8329175.1 glycoside hydrolase family 3 C-terminal domain-containing protein [Photobacterium obscurum]